MNRNNMYTIFVSQRNRFFAVRHQRDDTPARVFYRRTYVSSSNR